MPKRRRPPAFGFNDAWQNLGEEDFAAARAAGSSTGRVPFNWETYRDSEAFRVQLDQTIAGMRAAGIKPYLVPAGLSKPNMGQYKAVLRDLATKYRGQLKGIEVWNEPNSRLYGHFSPKQYKKLYKQGRNAINSVAPKTNIITAGLAPTAGHRKYLKKVARTKGDLILGAHVYPMGQKNLMRQGRKEMKAVMRAASRGKKKDRKVWITETGLSSNIIGENRQARLLPRLIRQQGRLGARVVTSHRLRDDPTFYPDNSWEQGLGAIRADGTPKPVYDRLVAAQKRKQRAAARRRRNR